LLSDVAINTIKSILVEYYKTLKPFPKISDV